MGAKIRTIKQRLPADLIAKIFETAGVAHSGRKPLTNLMSALDTFDKEHRRKGIEIPSRTSVNMAIFSKPYSFSEKTAKALCYYAYYEEGKLFEKSWEDFLTLHPKVKADPDYLFPKDQNGEEEKIAEKIIEPIADSVPQLDVPNNNRDNLLFDYLQRFEKKFEYIYLDIAIKETSIPIDNIIIPAIEPMDILPHFQIDPIEKESNFFAETELTNNSKILIVADGGQGKSTLGKCLFHSFARKFLNNETTTFPFFIELNRVSSIKEIIAGDLLLPLQDFHKAVEHLKDSTPLFILDGYDETGSDREKLIDDITNISTLFHTSKIVLTSRPDTDLQVFISNGFNPYRIKAYSNSSDALSYKGNYISRLLIKNKADLDQFVNYEAEVNLPTEISGNYLLYTFFILDFIRTRQQNKELSKNKILKTVLEDYYIKIWERGSTSPEKLLTFPFSIDPFLNILTMCALVSEHAEFFSKNERNEYFYTGHIIYTQKGLTQECIKNIILLHYKSLEQYTEEIIGLYCNSGLLVCRAYDEYVFGNRTTKDYFSARGIGYICFDSPRSILFIQNKKLKAALIKSLFKNKHGDVPHKIKLIACLVGDPEYIITQGFIKRSKCNYSSEMYANYLLFIANIVSERKGEIKTESRRSIIDILIKYSNEPLLPPHSYFFKFLYFIYKKHRWTNTSHLLQTKDILAFDFIFNHYTNPSFSEIVFPYWDYFESLPRNEQLYKHCIEIFLGGGTFPEIEKRCAYLIKWYPEVMIKKYTERLSLSKKGPGVSIMDVHLYSNLWRYASVTKDTDGNFSALINEFADALVKRLLESRDTYGDGFCREIIKACDFESASSLFGTRIINILLKTDSDEQILRLILLSKDLSLLSLESLEKHASYFDSLFNREKKEIGRQILVLTYAISELYRENERPVPQFIKDRLLEKMEQGDMNAWIYSDRLGVKSERYRDFKHCLDERLEDNVRRIKAAINERWHT